jgi:hypothetical protein
MLDWTGQTAVVIATGPSLTADDCAVVRDSGARVIAVNLAFRMAPFADVCFMGDYLAVKTYDHEVPKTMSKWACVPMAKDQFKWNFMRASNGVGLGPKGMIFNGGNSGYGAINLAYQFGAAKIVLLGFDMQKGEKGERHCHPDHPRNMTQNQPFDQWLPRFEPLAAGLKAAGIEVVNCTRRTALTAFRQGDLKEELK